MIILNCDGGCKGNPGDMTIGVVCKSETEEFSVSLPIGKGTNNIAEYIAVLLGLNLSLARYGHEEEVIVCSDSQLVVNQLNGKWDVKDVTLFNLYNKVVTAKEWFTKVEFKWIPREENDADRLTR